jgi:hypothetical protein
MKIAGQLSRGFCPGKSFQSRGGTIDAIGTGISVLLLGHCGSHCQWSNVAKHKNATLLLTLNAEVIAHEQVACE